MRFLTLLSGLLLIHFLQAQKKDTVFCDCQEARVLNLKASVNVGPTIAPPGEGAKKEVGPSKQNTRYSFEKEHHSAWYQLQIATDGKLVFDVIPASIKDDYDFMLFKANGDKFCDDLLKQRIKPVRACISRNKEEINGVTGLRHRYEKEMINEGPGEAFLKPLEVKSGEVYYLVLDNVYKDGEGHSLRFAFEELLKGKGKVVDADNTALMGAEITVTNMLGDTLFRTKSDAQGNFILDMALKKSTNYNLNVFAKNAFFYSRLFSTKLKDSLLNLKVVLKTLQSGEKYSITNINFGPDSDQYLRTAVPTLINLYTLLNMNENMKIRIIGHTNGCSGGSTYSEKLSARRALTIKKYLIKRGIDESRLASEGKGCSEMLYPFSAVPYYQTQNRRVEILIVEN